MGLDGISLRVNIYHNILLAGVRDRSKIDTFIIDIGYINWGVM